MSAVAIDWVIIPAGEFLMGSDKSKDRDAWSHELPQHRVYLAQYQIARCPVTNAQFAQFIRDTGYNGQFGSAALAFDSAKTNHPVTYIRWNDAVAFCEWAKVRLPTEAEWEKAARGTDGRIYPWGNEKPDELRCNFRGKTTTPVGSYPIGASPYGVLDMSGNAEEWVSDWYDENYYSVSLASNPQGPSIGETRVVRGGSWGCIACNVRSARRDHDHPGEYGYGTIRGFRCVRI